MLFILPYSLVSASAQKAQALKTTSSLCQRQTGSMSVFGNLLSQVKKHHNIIPMFLLITLGLSSATFYLLRIAIRHPDVSWNKKGNPEPWNKLPPNYQYKFLAVKTDYKNLKKDRPDF